jgi:hypothetical protein
VFGALEPVSDSFLLNLAEVSATLIGLFLVGVFFYVETGFRRLEHVRGVMEPYVRAGTRIVLILYALPLGLSLTLVVLGPNWNRVLFALFSLMLLAANIDTFMRIWVVARVTGSTVLLVNEVLGTVAVLFLVVLPGRSAVSIRPGKISPGRSSSPSPQDSSAWAPS